MHTGAAAPLPWYRSLNREQWRVLVASNLGWLFGCLSFFRRGCAAPLSHSALRNLCKSHLPVIVI